MKSSLRVMIADDDRLVRDLLRALLLRLGHDVIGVAENGQSLIAQCVADWPDVVITDNFMSDVNGLDAASEIYEMRPIPIILLSGYCDPALVRDAEDKHVLVYLVKPISQSHLEAALSKCREQLTELSEQTTPETDEVLVEPVTKVDNDPRHHAH